MNKKNTIIIILLMLLVSLFLFKISFGDSGWDTGYGGGGSYGGGGGGYSSSSSYDWDYDSSSRSRSKNSDNEYSGSDIVPMFYVICMFAVIIYVACSGPKLSYYKNDNKYFDMNNEELGNTIPGATLDNIKDMAYNKFVSIQNAWMNFDYDTLKKECSDELFNTYKEQLEMLSLKKQKNIMNDFNIMNIRVISAKKDNISYSVEVYLRVSFFDYVVDSSNKVVQGSNNYKIINSYRMTFIKNIKDNLKCPSCGGAIEDVSLKVCPYCRNKIALLDNNDFVLSKKVNEGTVRMGG